MQIEIGTINAIIDLIMKIAGIIGMRQTQVGVIIVAFVAVLLFVVFIYQLPKILNSLSLIGNNSLRKKEQVLQSDFIEADTKSLVNENLQLSFVSKITGLRIKSLAQLKKYNQILNYSQGEINQGQLKKAAPYLTISDKKLIVKLTKFDILTKYVGGIFWWLLVAVGILSFIGCFISLMRTNFSQPLDAKTLADLSFYPLMSIAVFMMGFAYLKMYLEVDAAEKIQDFMKRYPDWDK